MLFVWLGRVNKLLFIDLVRVRHLGTLDIDPPALGLLNVLVITVLRFKSSRVLTLTALQTHYVICGLRFTARGGRGRRQGTGRKLVIIDIG